MKSYFGSSPFGCKTVFMILQGKTSNTRCHSCSEWKSEIQTVKSEVKSLSEIIKILTEEAKPLGANKETNKLTYTDSVSTTQCGKCNQPELRLQTALNEVSSLKAIVNILNEDSKLSKPTTKTSSDMTNPWTVVLANNSRGSRTTTQPKPSSCETFYSLQYAVPTTNRYAALSNSQ
jgi:S-ribosylhomocysteine lyase LuxS involved in autoinducer biosynthesis